MRPLVCGKSGSILVNSSGCDLCFSLNENDGPSRVKLKNEKLDWCKTQILVKNFKDEKEALEFEKYIQYKYNLFGS